MKIAAAIILVIAVVANAQEEGAGKPNKKTTIYVLSRRLKRHRSCHHSLSRSLQALQVQLSTPPTCLCRVRRPARRRVPLNSATSMTGNQRPTKETLGVPGEGLRPTAQNCFLATSFWNLPLAPFASTTFWISLLARARPRRCMLTRPQTTTSQAPTPWVTG